MTPAASRIVIRAVLVDDEPLAREGLRLRLGRESDVEIVGEAGDGPSGIRCIVETQPDLVFLDVQMPGMDGFQLVREIAPVHLPLIVFVTAFDEFAVRAFEVHAVDYLLKPVAQPRLEAAVARVRRELARDDRVTRDESLVGLLDSLDSLDRLGRLDSSDAPAVAGSSRVDARLQRFTVKEGSRYLIVRAADIDWIGAAANYAELWIGARSYLVRRTIAELERRLDPGLFVRIHRSAIVNLERIREITPDSHGDSEVVLTSGTVLRMSRSYRGRLLPKDRST